KHIVTWIYHIPDLDLAVQFECLESEYSKQQSQFVHCFRSFKSIPRNGEAITEASTGPSVTISIGSKADTPEDRKRERQIAEQRAHERATKTAPAGWTAK